jgi:hypothetical protein
MLAYPCKEPRTKTCFTYKQCINSETLGQLRVRCEFYRKVLRLGKVFKLRRLRVSENMILRIFGPNRDEVTGEWRKLHNEELNGLYSTPNIVRLMKSRITR